MATETQAEPSSGPLRSALNALVSPLTAAQLAGRKVLQLALMTGFMLACSQRGAEAPGIPLGAPGTSWAAKNDEQRFGYMAAQVHPIMSELFIEYDPDNSGFTCSNCHGENMEQIDYAMPNESLYGMPSDRPYDDALDFDGEIAVFMMTKVTPTLQELFNKGDGPPTKVTCFTCHPKTE